MKGNSGYYFPSFPGKSFWDPCVVLLFQVISTICHPTVTRPTFLRFRSIMNLGCHRCKEVRCFATCIWRPGDRLDMLTAFRTHQSQMGQSRCAPLIATHNLWLMIRIVLQLKVNLEATTGTKSAKKCCHLNGAKQLCSRSYLVESGPAGLKLFQAPQKLSSPTATPSNRQPPRLAWSRFASIKSALRKSAVARLL